jgi:hypothetical protein
MAKGRKKGKGKAGARQLGSANDRMQIASTRGTGVAEVSFPREDYARSRVSWALTQTPPRSVGNLIHWVRGCNQSAVTVSASAPTEQTQTFAVSALTDLANLIASFDQFCIYSVVVSINFNYTGTTPSGLGTMYTAIDLDNAANLGNVLLYQGYESVLVTKVTPTQSVQRLIHPCVSPALYGGSTFNAFGIGRFWVDSASPATPHYGFRSFFISNVGTTLTATYDMTYIIGLRNNIG